jgi:hypothetical protein
MSRAIAAIFVGLLVAAGLGVTPTRAAAGDDARVYGTVEYLLWWIKDSPAAPPLVSTGTLGDPGVRVLLGGTDIDTGEHHGGRFTLGVWLTQARDLGLEASGFVVPESSVQRSVSSSGQPGSQDLFIPFFDVTRPGENTTRLSEAGEFAGTAQESLTSSLDGAELNVVRQLVASPAWRLDLLGGFRYLRLNERLTFSTSSPLLPPELGDIFIIEDAFETDNAFYGGQLGLRGEHRWGRFFVQAAVKVGLGAMHQAVDIRGSLVANEFNQFGEPQTFPGGYFAQPTNIGEHARDVFAVLPEGRVTLGLQLTPWAALTVGYTFLYASDVVRPGEQIDRGINPTQNPSFTGAVPSPLVGPARPAFSFRGSDVWAQGLTVGVALRF